MGEVQCSTFHNNNNSGQNNLTCESTVRYYLMPLYSNYFFLFPSPAPPRAVSNITMTGSNISWEPLPSRARVERSHVDILFNGSTVLYSTNTTGTSNSIQLVREDLVACLKGCSCSVNVVVVFEKKQSPATELQVPQCLDSSQTTSESPTEQPETTAGE